MQTDREAGERAIRRARRTVIGSAVGLTAAVTSWVWVDTAVAGSTTAATTTTTSVDGGATSYDDSSGSWAQGDVGPGSGGSAPHAISGGS